MINSNNMRTQASSKYGGQYQAVEDVIEKEENKLAFQLNYILLTISALFFAELYWAVKYKHLNLFIYTTLAIDIAYPFLLKMKQKKYSWKLILLQGTLIPSILYSCWALFYPHKTYIYYIPPFLGAIGKIYHHISPEPSKDVSTMVEDMVKFNSKIEVLIVIYAILSYFIKFKTGWLKILKVLALLVIYRFKYYNHYGFQLAWSQIHFGIDRLSRAILLRQYYQQLYAKLSWFSNPFNSNQVIIF